MNQPDKCPWCQSPIDNELSGDGDIFFDCGSFDSELDRTDETNPLGIPCGLGQSQTCQITCLTRERDALREKVSQLMDRMDRARAILTDNNPRPECNWGMLDTKLDRAAIVETKEKP